MPGRLIVFILMIFVIMSFIGFNFNNTSDIRIWFGDNHIFEDVPISFSFPFMYVLGIFSAIPFYWSWTIKKRKKQKNRGPRPSSKSVAHKDSDKPASDSQGDLDEQS